MAKKTYRPINPKAKKYQGLAKKQAEANRYLKEARQTLGKDHRAYVNAMSKLHMFQRKHGLDRKSTLSMSGLTTKDVELYTELVDSIRDSTYLNPTKYKEHMANQVDYFIREGWGSTPEEVKAFMDFRNSDLFESIADENLPPSTLLDKAAEYNEGQFTLDEFGNFIRLFMKENSGKPTNKSEFFDYADKLAEAKRDRPDDFDKAVDYYLSSEAEDDFDFMPSFFDFLDAF